MVLLVVLYRCHGGLSTRDSETDDTILLVESISHCRGQHDLLQKWSHARQCSGLLCSSPAQLLRIFKGSFATYIRTSWSMLSSQGGTVQKTLRPGVAVSRVQRSLASEWSMLPICTRVWKKAFDLHWNALDTSVTRRFFNQCHSLALPGSFTHAIHYHDWRFLWLIAISPAKRKSSWNMHKVIRLER